MFFKAHKKAFLFDLPTPGIDGVVTNFSFKFSTFYIHISIYNKINFFQVI